MTSCFLPEGRRLAAPENLAACASRETLLAARDKEQILEGTVLLCDAAHDLLVKVGPHLGRIPREETALGVAEGTTREIAILSRVGKPVAFTVTAVEGEGAELHLTLSRRRAQMLCAADLSRRLPPGTILPATVTHLEPFGAFVDIGCGLPSMISVEQISVSRIPHPACRFTVGQEIFAVVTAVDDATGRVQLTHRELLGTWEENAADLAPGMTIPGWVRGVKDYGVFVELFPNLSGLAEPKAGLQEGDRVSVYLKALIPQRMKIKLLVIDTLPPGAPPDPLRYRITAGRLRAWRYAPPSCDKEGAETVFLPTPF